MLVAFCKKVSEVAEGVRETRSGLQENKDNEVTGHVAHV